VTVLPDPSCGAVPAALAASRGKEQSRARAEQVPRGTVGWVGKVLLLREGGEARRVLLVRGVRAVKTLCGKVRRDRVMRRDRESGRSHLLALSATGQLTLARVERRPLNAGLSNPGSKNRWRRRGSAAAVSVPELPQIEVPHDWVHLADENAHRFT
jgi:hypothetical protein